MYTEKVPNTPDLPKTKSKLNKDDKTSTPENPKQKSIKINREVKTTIKKRKDMTVTELVTLRAMQNDVESLTRKVQNVAVTKKSDNIVNRLSFVASLAGMFFCLC